MAKSLFKISANPYYRRGAYFGVSCVGGEEKGHPKLWISSRRGSACASLESSRLIGFKPLYNGEKIPFEIHTSATEITLTTQYGGISICFPEYGLMLVKGSKGMGLRFQKSMKSHELLKPRGDSAWEVTVMQVGSLVFNAIDGVCRAEADWDWEKLCTPSPKLDILPGKDGMFFASVEEFTHAGYVRQAYPSYEDGLRAVKDDFNAFLDTIPHFTGAFEDRREEAAYMVWSHLVSPAGQIKRPLIYMFSTICASSWQMCHNAMALGSIDLGLSVELLLNMFDHASPVGQLPDFYDDSRGVFYFIKPPQQGWALKVLFEKHPDFAKKVPAEKIAQLYGGLEKWADWFMTYRDDDHDGIPQYEHPDEAGLDDNSVFKYGNVMETPDLMAYLALIYESLGDMAEMLKLGKDTARQWMAKSKDMIRKMIDTMWNGERFVALISGTHREVATDSLLYYMPIVLGKRLPKDILDKMAADLSVEGDFLTPNGIATEKLSTSRDVSLSGSLALGAIIPPSSIAVCLGLLDGGHEELAVKIASRTCRAMAKGGLSFLINPKFGAMGSAGSWASCCYLILADLCTQSGCYQNAASSLQEILDFIAVNSVGYIATIDGEQPRVRPFGFGYYEDGKFWFCTNNTKKVFRQLRNNPYAEVLFCKDDYSRFLRLSGRVVFDETLDAKAKVMEMMPSVKGLYDTPDNPVFEVFYLEKGKAVLEEFPSVGVPKALEF